MLHAPRPLTPNARCDALRASADACRLIPELSPGQVPIFRILWAMQYPVVVHGIQKKLQGNWSPQSFAQTYGNEEALMLHSASPNPQKVTVKTFFTEFVRSHEERGGTIKLKVGILSFSPQLFEQSNYCIGLATHSIVRGLTEATLQGFLRRGPDGRLHTSRWYTERDHALP